MTPAGNTISTPKLSLWNTITAEDTNTTGLTHLHGFLCEDAGNLQICLARVNM